MNSKEVARVLNLFENMWTLLTFDDDLQQLRNIFPIKVMK